MITIKIKGPLPEQLKDAGLKPGDKLNAFPSEISGNTDDLQVKLFVENSEYYCTISKNNYTILHKT